MTLKTKLKNFFALERNIVTFMIANLFWATIVLYRSFLPKFYESLGATVYFVGILFSLSDLFYSIASFFGGYISDTHGRKNVLIKASFVGNFLLLGYFFAPNWIVLIPFLILGNFFAGLGDTPSHTLITESLPKKRRATGLASIYLTATTLSAVLIPIGALIIQNYGMLDGVKITILISFFFTFIGNVIFLLYGKETLHKKIKEKFRFNLNFSNFRNFFSKLPHSIKGMVLFISLFYFATALLTPYWIFYAMDIIKISSFEFGVLASIQFITVAFSTFVGAKLSDKHGRKKILLISTFLFLIAPLLFILSNNFVHLIIVQIIGGISTLGFSTIFAYIADNIDKKRRSKAIGVTNGLMTFVGVPAPMIGSVLYSIMPQYPFLFSTVLLLITLIAGIKFLK